MLSVMSVCLSSLLPVFLLICVSSLFNTTNNGHSVMLFSCIAVDQCEKRLIYETQSVMSYCKIGYVRDLSRDFL